jgi:dihydroflavonol-4-reductase
MPPETVLVTGASGSIAGYVIEELLRHGYAVRGTVRSLAATDKVEHLRALDGPLEFVEARLDADEGWAEAVAGCRLVLHVASPNPPAVPRDEQELIRPAVDGTLRVLRAAAEDGGVRRVVLTSSIAAITAGHAEEKTYTEDDWSVSEQSPAYEKSKTLAERAAWDFVADLPEDRRFELVAVNPGLVLGPLQRPEVATSLEIISRLLNRSVPAVPKLGFAVVDVRDLAAFHRLAMESPKAPGNRYILAGSHTWMGEMARTLAASFNPQGYRVPTAHLPTPLFWLAARFDPTLRLALKFVGREVRVSSDKARDELGWSMRPTAETVLDTGRSLVERGLGRARG